MAAKQLTTNQAQQRHAQLLKFVRFSAAALKSQMHSDTTTRAQQRHVNPLKSARERVATMKLHRNSSTRGDSMAKIAELVQCALQHKRAFLKLDTAPLFPSVMRADCFAHRTPTLMSAQKMSPSAKTAAMKIHLNA
jgi:hypothetical protein